MTNPFPVSEHVARMHSSSTLKAGQTAAKLREEGHDVIDLTVGEPDFDTRNSSNNTRGKDLQKGLTKYTSSAGMKLFTESIAEFYASSSVRRFQPTEVAAACGGKQALFNAACTFLNPGDDVLIPKPYWVTFPEIATFCRANSVFIETEETDFVLTADQVRDAITERRELLIINSPNNPTGRVIPADEMRKNRRGLRRERSLRSDRRVLSVLRLSAGRGFHIGGASARAAKIRLRRRELFKNVCDDRMANRIHDRKRGMDACDGKTPEPFGDASDVVRAVRVCTGDAESRRDDRCRQSYVRGVRTPTRLADPGVEYDRRIQMRNAEGAFYAFVDVREMLGDRFKTSADVADEMLNWSSCRRDRRCRIRCRRISAILIRDIDGESSHAVERVSSIVGSAVRSLEPNKIRSLPAITRMGAN